jgi:hypothetical protein
MGHFNEYESVNSVTLLLRATIGNAAISLIDEWIALSPCSLQ